MERTVRVGSLVWFASGVVVSLLVTAIVMQTWRADAAPGDNDTTLVPVTPCRLVDTRQPGQTILGAGETRTVSAHGTHGPIPGSQCTIPADAVGLSMNVTALDATAGNTFLTIWQNGVARPEASSLNPAPGQPPTPNAVNTPISTAGEFNVFNFAGTVQLIVDVNGYYTKASLQELANRLTAVEAAQATNAANIAALDAREPFSVTNRTAQDTVGPNTTEQVVAVSMTAPAAGHVTVASTAAADQFTSGHTVWCSIKEASSPPVISTQYLQEWQSSGFGDGSVAQLAGTRRFDIAAGATVTYELVCWNIGLSTAVTMRDIVITAIYTPAT